MFNIFLVLIMIVAFLLIVVIMVQNPKGGGLGSSFGGETQQMAFLCKAAQLPGSTVGEVAVLVKNFTSSCSLKMVLAVGCR